MMTQPLLDQDKPATGASKAQETQEKVIKVLGGGVIGLTTALVLQRTPGLAVQLISKSSVNLNENTDLRFTSPKAGAHWRSTAAEDDKQQQGIFLLSITCYQ
jgi:D-amino-acid oxidase